MHISELYITIYYSAQVRLGPSLDEGSASSLDRLDILGRNMQSYTDSSKTRLRYSDASAYRRNISHFLNAFWH